MHSNQNWKRIYNIQPRFIFLVTIALLIIFSCKKDPVQTKPITPIDSYPKKILFVGNSHTYYNEGLDFHLRNFLDANDSLNYEKIEREARSGYRLEQHWVEMRTRDAIANEDWDKIILQENSYVAYNEPEKLLPIVEQFNTLVLGNDQELVLFMTWAYRDTASMIDNISMAYEDTAEKLALQMVPAGFAWRDFRIAHPEIELHNQDGYHPDITGSFFTAAIFYASLFDVNPAENVYKPESLDAETANLLKQAAWEAYLKYK